jgi:hypothetical protein
VGAGHAVHHGNEHRGLHGFEHFVLGWNAGIDQLQPGGVQQCFGKSKCASVLCIDRDDHSGVGMEFAGDQRLPDLEREHDLLGWLHHGQQCD